MFKIKPLDIKYLRFHSAVDLEWLERWSMPTLSHTTCPYSKIGVYYLLLFAILLYGFLCVQWLLFRCTYDITLQHSAVIVITGIRWMSLIIFSTNFTCLSASCNYYLSNTKIFRIFCFLLPLKYLTLGRFHTVSQFYDHLSSFSYKLYYALLVCCLNNRIMIRIRSSMAFLNSQRNKKIN
jgi:hypothetical protein